MQTTTKMILAICCIGAVAVETLTPVYAQHRHRQPVPEQGLIIWVEVVVARAKTSQENAEEKQHGCWGTTKLPKSCGTDTDEGNIRDHVPEMRYAEERALISEVMIILVLNYRWYKNQSEERRKHKNEKSKYAATLYRAAREHLSSVAKAADQVRKRALRIVIAQRVSVGGFPHNGR